ncbi:MAG: hypothetical protein R2851_15120 [Caldilineaceae bacterium]
MLDDPAFLAHTPVLINGDIGPYHVLCDRDARRITGIIDFGTAAWATRLWILRVCSTTTASRSCGAWTERIPRTRHGRTGTILCGDAGQWLLGGLRSDDKEAGSPSTLVASDVMPLGSGW